MKGSVTAGGWLHLGFTNLCDDIGRWCGSIGVAIDRPRTIVTVAERDEAGVDGDESEQVRACVRRFADHYGVDPRVSITVRERIPQHAGLGSGTQLALAIGLGLARVCGVDASVWDIAMAMGRCRRSAIGTAAFQAGGLVIDAGRRKDDRGDRGLPTVVWRRDFPADWRFVMVVPTALHGLSGPGEERVFDTLAPSVRVSEEVCRVTLLRLMPSLIEQDIDEFGRALTAIDRKTGEYFAALQGGTYGASETAETIAAVLQAGVRGAGQSSWGPAVYGLTHEDEVQQVQQRVRALLAEKEIEASVFVSHGRNTEARVDVEHDRL